MPVEGNMLNGGGFDERLDLGFKFLDKFIETDTGTDPIDIDVVGFSRGATEARVWINQLVAKLKDGKYTAGEKTRCINIRFEGLWDTVPHLGYLNGNERKYDFSIPAVVKHAVHAVALNEHRGGATNFDVRSIWNSSGSTSSANRIEKGFIGSHADIGGAYGTGDLSDVALMWMINQASSQGIAFQQKVIVDQGWDTITNPILHDKSENKTELGEVSFSRDVVYGTGRRPTVVEQRRATFDGKNIDSTKPVVTYFPNPYRCIKTYGVGMVNMTDYHKWLDGYGVTMKIGTPANNPCI